MEKLLTNVAQQNVLDRCNEKEYVLVEPFFYKNSKSKIHLKCSKDNHEWYVNYNNFINNNTCCKKCTGTLKLTQEQANKFVSDKCKERNYILVNSFSYENNESKLHLKCNADGYEWYITYYNYINNNRGCPKCSKHLKITQEEAEVNVLSTCNKKKYKLLEPFQYKNSQTKIHLKCDIDNYEWYSSYDNFINNGAGCRKCYKTAKLTLDELNDGVLKRCKEINCSITKPVINKNNIYLRCNIDGYEWNCKYNSFVNNKTGCPKCGGVAKITQEYAENIVNKRCIKMNYSLIEPFVFKTNKTKIKLKCNNCGHFFSPTYNGFISAETGCKKCNQSKGEERITNFLNLKKIDFIQEYKFDDCKYVRKLLFDFYLPEYKLLIEYDGEQHFQPQNCWGGEKEFQIIKKRDEIKNRFCTENQIDLLRIKYNENVEEKIDQIINKHGK